MRGEERGATGTSMLAIENPDTGVVLSTRNDGGKARGTAKRGLVEGTGYGSAHSPFLASRASVSSPSSTVFPGAYFRYHQHQRCLTSV